MQAVVFLMMEQVSASNNLVDEDDDLNLISYSESDGSDVEVRPARKVPRGRAKSGRIWKHTVTPKYTTVFLWS